MTCHRAAWEWLRRHLPFTSAWRPVPPTVVMVAGGDGGDSDDKADLNVDLDEEDNDSLDFDI